MATNIRLTSIRSSTVPPRLCNVRLIQNFHLVWLDENIDENKNEDYRNSIMTLRQVVNTVNVFTDVNKCIDFINSIKEEKTFMICSGALGQTTVPIVHDKAQMNTIYVFCGNETRHEKWAKEWCKVAGVYTDIKPICEALKQAVQDCDHNSVSISFVKTTNGMSDQLDKSFMYTQILKEILLTIDFEQKHIDEFLRYCREKLADNKIELNNIEKLRKEYDLHEPIWWYTYECFLYSMLNRALRSMEVDLIIKMGFYIRDLHNHIARLHSEQYNGCDRSDTFTVFRGQGLSHVDFEQLQATQGGLLSFNNFLSTSQNRDISLDFARRTIATSDLVGVLFILKIDPSINATPFANVGSIGCFSEENEILFSMHSVFRIGRIRQDDSSARLWRVELTLTSENDPQLQSLTEYMREETSSIDQGWHRLGKLMIRLGEFNQAKELYNILLEQTSDEREQGFLFYQLGWLKDNQGNYAEAIELYEKSIEINKETLSENHPDLAASYNNHRFSI